MIFLSTLLISMFIAMALIPILRMAAVRLHAGLDLPNPRKVHDHPVPKVGGLAMAAGALLPVLLVADGGAFINSVLIGAWIIVVFGMVDDIKGLGWKAKFAGQLAAALGFGDVLQNISCSEGELGDAYCYIDIAAVGAESICDATELASRFTPPQV
jgi:UDP-GlcNAc:undecaprenyl-phosphate GlcNAc-1-phosphate transferase